jgi:hypothetical protein
MSAQVSGNTISDRIALAPHHRVTKVLGHTARGIGAKRRLGKDHTELGSGDMQLDQL